MFSVFPRLSMVSAQTDKLNKQFYTEDKLCQSRGTGRLTDEAFKHIKHVRGRFVRSQQRWLRIHSLNRLSIRARARTPIRHTSLKMTVNTPESEINSLLCQCYDCRHETAAVYIRGDGLSVSGVREWRKAMERVKQHWTADRGIPLSFKLLPCCSSSRPSQRVSFSHSDGVCPKIHNSVSFMNAWTFPLRYKVDRGWIRRKQFVALRCVI